MSYILDALKRAEAERERGAVPGLHSQPMARAAAVSSGGVRRTVGWCAAGSSLALVVLAAVVWFWPAPVPLVPKATWLPPR
jgi:general secretion pathway protein B